MGILISLLTGLAPLIRALFPYLVAFGLGMAAQHKIEAWWHAKADGPKSVTENVVEVIGGSVLRVTGGGLVGLRSRQATIAGIEIPPEVADQAKANLGNLVQVGQSVRIEVGGGGDVRGDISGDITSQSGTDLGIKQLEAGLAKDTENTKEHLAAQKAAQKAKAGIWKDYKPGWFGAEADEEANNNRPALEKQLSRKSH